MWLFSFPSTAYRRDYLFPIVYYCLLSFRLGDWGVSGWYTDIINYDIFINPFIEKNHRNPKSMDEKNFTTVKEFILLGFMTDLWLQRVLFYILLIIYIMSLLGTWPWFFWSVLILGSIYPRICSLEVCHSWISGMLLYMPPKSWWPASLMTNASLLLTA